MAAFRELGETELERLDDGEIVGYALAARSAGRDDQAQLALRIFAFGMEAGVRAFVRLRLDSHGDTTIEEVAERALGDAVRSIGSLRGATAAEARAFVFKIARLRIVDFHRSGRVSTVPLEPGEGGGDSMSLEYPAASVDGESDAVDLALLVGQILAELREDHRAVVELYVISGFSARETADAVRSRFDGQFDDSMTEQNVHQIGSRFRKDLRARLERAAGGQADE